MIRWLLTGALLVALPLAEAAADVGDVKAEIDRIGKRALARARRAYVFGPHLGVAGAIDSDSNADAAITLGLGLTKFAISVFPSKKRLLELAEGRFRKLMAERVAAAIAGGANPSEADMKRFADETFEEVRAEILLELEPKRFEKPAFALRTEGTYFVDSRALDFRLTFAYGVSRVFLGTGLILKIDDGAAFAIPVEVSVPMALGSGGRSHLLDFFARADLAISGRSERPDVFLVGARLTFDTI